MIKIALCGVAGRMGREVINACKTNKNLKIIGGIEVHDNKLVGDAIEGIKIYDDILAVVGDADCVVEFTNHTATVANLRKTKKYKKPYVIGTTGFSDAELKEIKNLSKGFPILVSPNMSIGVNHLYNLVKTTARALSEYDIEIIETHHHAKKDAPSGTAKAIAEIIRQARPKTKFIYGREGMVGERKSDEVCVSSIRGGDVVGEHRVLFLGNGEFIELRHFATSRQCFAYGTLEAIRFIIGKEPGLYSMQELLNNWETKQQKAGGKECF